MKGPATRVPPGLVTPCVALLAIMTFGAAAAPPLPANLRHEVYSDTAAEIFWDRSTYIDPIRGYEVTRNGESLGVLDVLSVFDDTLVPGIDYTYTVTAVGRFGERSPPASLVLRTPRSADAIAALEREIARLRAMLANGAPAPVPRTGQTASRRPGDDGDRQAGVPLPSARFVRGVRADEDIDEDGLCGEGERCDGTVTDRLTGLTWLLDANCFGTAGWEGALAYANALADDGSGACGLDDASRAGDWRLPNVREMISLLDFSRLPALPPDHPFENVVTFEDDGLPARYWTSTSRTAPDTGDARDDSGAYAVSTGVARVESRYRGAEYHVWPVR